MVEVMAAVMAAAARVAVAREGAMEAAETVAVARAMGAAERVATAEEERVDWAAVVRHRTGRPRRRFLRHRGCGSRGSRVVSRSPAGKRSR